MLGPVALAALLGATSVLAATECSLDNKCPEEAPCCSQFGQCGVGAYCLGGCDPRMSFSLEACVPAPVCQDSHTKFSDLDSMVKINDYLGDPDDGAWIRQGDIRQYQDSALLTMPKNSGGSLISSSTYMWYGNVKARMKTSRGQGVVTAFILFSDVKDEIDYEWVGVDLETAQTNYYFQGITDYTESANITLSDTFHNFHDYEINWTPDKVEWLVDGQVGRTKLRKDTWNETSQQWMFPQTPSRVQLSIWPGGLASNPKGTKDWAGGEIDWDSSDIQKYGYYWATVEEITIECYSADSPPGTNDKVSYVYDNLIGTNDTVKDTDDPTVLGSLQDTGIHMGRASGTDSGSKPTGTANSVPYGNGATGEHSGSDSSSGGADSVPGSGGGSSGSSSDVKNCDTSSFHSSCNSDDSGGSGGSGSGSGGKNSGSQNGASALAIVVASCALYWL